MLESSHIAHASSRGVAASARQNGIAFCQAKRRVWHTPSPQRNWLHHTSCGIHTLLRRQGSPYTCSASPTPHQISSLQNPSPRTPRPAPAALWGKPSPTVTSSSESSRRKTTREPGPPKHDDDEEDSPGWGWFDGSRYSHRWDVPWGWGTTVGGMSLWFLSFIVVGIVAVPGLYKLAGADPSSLPGPSKAVFTLACQAVETVVGLAVIRLMTAKALDTQEQTEDKAEQLFNFSLESPFRAPYGWATWAIAGIFCSPLVVGATASLVSLVGYDDNVGGKGTVDGVAGMIDVDLPSYLSLLIVTGVLAPILEETVFRGFLLPSLSKHMPTWAAVSLSSLAFGAAHLSPRDLPVLVALGGLLGVSYVRSRNILTPIIIHGVWNSTVLTLLFGLAASGVDIETALKELR